MVVAGNFISQYVPEKGMTTIFEDPDAQIVDKNILSYFAIKGNKLYLYSLEKVKKAKQQKQLEAQPESLHQPTEKPVEKANENTAEKPSDNTLQKLIEETSEVQTEAIEKLIN